MKKLIFAFMLIFSVKAICQDSYFLGKTNYCTPEKSESRKKFDAAILGLNYPKYYAGITKVLFKAIEEDPKYCDAYFMAGYYFRLQDLHKEALTLYYVADSLANNKAPIFKQNLAIEFMRLGVVDKAREKYVEMVKFFPENPEGFYGIGNTSIIIGDYDFGLENLQKAEQLYNGSMKDDGKFMYALLYSFKEDYIKALPFFDKVYATYKNDDAFIAMYAIAQAEVGKTTNDEKLQKKAKKSYEKIKGKKFDENIEKKLKANFS